jgi:hypothetical protein
MEQELEILCPMQSVINRLVLYRLLNYAFTDEIIYHRITGRLMKGALERIW